MRPSNRQRRILALLAIAGVVGASVAVSTSSAAVRPAFPPNGVYTCDWIAAHPAAAAAARVTCDPVVFSAGMSALDTMAPATPDANGCQPVPAGGGRVGKGVWAWLSTYEYANVWQWVGHYSPSWYTWYIKKTNGTTQVWGENYDTSAHSVGVPSNVYTWGAQNHSDTAQNWTVCYTG
jgi:hypothetical protein